MGQFDIHRNLDPGSRARTPFLLDIQSNVLSPLATRIIVPLRPSAAMERQAITRLHLRIEVEGSEQLAIVSEMAAIPQSRLGPVVRSAPQLRQGVTDALDLIFTGF
jgi:toxin CcdB